MGGQQAVGMTVFTHRHWLACLSGETRNFVFKSTDVPGKHISDHFFFLLRSIGSLGSYG